MRLFLLVLFLIITQFSYAQKKATWTIESDSTNEVFTGAGFTLLGEDSVQLINDSVVLRLAIKDISKISVIRPGQSGVYAGLIGAVGVATIFVASFLENNKNNDSLSSDDKTVISFLIANAGVFLGGAAGFLTFNRWKRHHEYDLTGLTFPERQMRIRDIWRRK